MSKSSIHIENGHSGYLAHNDRSKATANSIFKHNKNEIWNSKEDAFKMYRFELAARSDAYSKRTHQKLQKKTTTHLSAIVNLNENHNLDDVKKVASLLERELDTKVFQIALHRDEGHINDKGEEVVNFHAHIEFMGLDQEGRSIRQKLKKKMLMDLQSETAMVLKMERGKEYVKGMHPRPKRLDTYEYKAHKKEESKTVKAKQKDLKEDIAKLKKQLQEQGAKREQYAELEQLNRDLKAKIKAKDLTIEQMQEQINQHGAFLWAKDDHIRLLKEQNQTLEAKIKTLPSQDTLDELKTLKNEFEELQQENGELWELAYEDDYETVFDYAGNPTDKTFTYKERYENSLDEIKELKSEIEKDNTYINKLDKGYEEIEKIIYGEAKERKLEVIIDTIGNMHKLLSNVVKFLKIDAKSFLSLFKQSVPTNEEVEKAKPKTGLDPIELPEKKSEPTPTTRIMRP